MNNESQPISGHFANQSHWTTSDIVDVDICTIAASFNETVFGSFVFRREEHYQNITPIEK